MRLKWCKNRLFWAAKSQKLPSGWGLRPQAPSTVTISLITKPPFVIRLRSGAYLGESHWAMAPPFGSPGYYDSRLCKIVAWPPLSVTWAEGLSTETVGEDLFLAKNRTKFEWKPFCFGYHLSLGRKTNLVWGWKIFILVFITLKVSEFPAPLSKILRTLLLELQQFV